MPRPPQIPQRNKSTPKVAKTQSAVDKAMQLFKQGFALHQQGKLNEAKTVYEAVLEINSKHFDALNLSGTVEAQLGEFEVAVDLISRAIAINPNEATCYNNCANALLELNQLEAALANYDKAIQIKPDYADAYFNRGNALSKLQTLEATLASYDKAIELKPDYAAAYVSRGNTLLKLGHMDAALASYQMVLKLQPSLVAYLPGFILHTQMHLCDWNKFEDEVNDLLVEIRRNQKASMSFCTLALTDDLTTHFQAAYIWYKDTCPFSPALGPISKVTPKEKIRVGYYSADFHNHATACLMVELFERHDKSKFEVIGFSFGPAVQDAMRQRLEAAFSQFIDVRLQSDRDVAQLSRTMGIDIAIDLKGYTTDSRPEVFSYRAAPIQISYLGYPGTMAAEYIDYLIADPTLVPVESQKHYSEKIIYLPDSYQVNDRQRVVADTVYSRYALGLPPEGFVFCCFNNNYKITPPTFDGWMRILHAVPGSVLWLLEGNATAAINLRKEAQARSIDPQRLVFAKRMDLPEHLARHRAADLFIDTLPYNAHTTASDALWAGLPVLTCMGESFASRVAGSLLNAIGMPELVTATQAGYEAMAIDLALNPSKLAALKAKLEKNRLTTPLFDTPRFTKHLEAAYAQVYQRYRDDLPPEHVHISVLEAKVDALESSDEIAAMFQQGFALQQQGKLNEARSVYEKVLNINPKHFDALNMYGTVQAQLGNFEEAVDLISRAIAFNSNHASCYNNRGNALLKLGQLNAALADFDKTVQLKPDYADVYKNRGNVLLELKQPEAAIANYDQAIQLQPNNAQAHCNRGNALLELKQPEAALASYDKAIQFNPDYANAYYNRGNALLNIKQTEAAIASYDQAIQLKPDNVYAHNNRGNALLKLRQPEGALASYDKAIELKPEYADAHNNRGNTLLELNQLEDAIASYDKAIVLKPEYANAYNGRGTALLQLKQLEAALASYDKAIQLKPDCDDAYFNRGNALSKLQQPEAALASYDKAIQVKPDHAAAYVGRGNTLLKHGQTDAALASYQIAFELEPDSAYLPGFIFHSCMRLCDWRRFEDSTTSLCEKIKNNQKVSTSFPVLALVDALTTLYQATSIWLKNTSPFNPILGPLSKPSAKDKIHIGYYSADFHNHATAFLMAELFERHDKSKFEVIGFSFGPAVQDAMRQRLEAAFSQFIDVRLQSDKDVAQLSRTMGIDIAIDLKGYTTDSRPGIFSYRAAPIQISYLGYPGTMAAEYIDYLIADATLVPVESQKYYSEKIIYLPDSYQVNDRQRAIGDTVYSREALGLPPEGFVFCCFNNNYKITPPTFDGWMRILHAVPGSVLWLLEDNATAAVNLRKEAQARGIDPQRLVFAKRMDLPEHLARHRAADLFIDTLPCNAHTTASDALWAGLPVLTCMGESFASRVAGSLLNAIGMPEMVTTTQADYEALAIDLALSPAKLAALKAKLEKNRLTTPLFDTPRFTRHLEAAYAQVYQRYRDDLPAEHVYVDRVEAAIDALESTDEIAPLLQRGFALHQQGKLSEARFVYEAVLKINAKNFDALSMLGAVELQLGKFEAAVDIISRAIAINPNHASCYNNRGGALLELKQLEAALADLDKAVQLKPDYANAHNNRGIVLRGLRQIEAALASYDKAIQFKSDHADAYFNRGNALRGLKQLDAALASYQMALELQPDLAYLYGHTFHAQMHLCDWKNFESKLNILIKKIEINQKISPSFVTIALTDSLTTHYQGTLIWLKDKLPFNPVLGPISKSTSKDRIRIGYYSADFHGHATAQLMAELFERHDKSKFEVIGFSFGLAVQDAMRQRLEAAFSQFIDVRLQSDKDVAQFSRAMGIDIAIDLKGYTADSRPGIFSYRAAPIQISYLGYPGTMAAEYIDYLIADPTLVPVESQKHYSEKIIYLPDSYQVNDRQRVIADTVYTRDALGLPQEGFVFCCFNNNYKITPPTFDGWMRILHAVPGGVLWLLEDNATAAVNLRKEAQARGIDPQCLVFAKRMELPEHLARHRAADLFIDTLPCNAHTTASDALWAGLPVLTCMGQSFASRVAGSLLNAIGMPELVTTTQADYEALAIDLALNPAKLAALKAKLEKNRLTTPLFDTPRFTKHLEAAYAQVYQRYRDDLPPEHVYVNGGVGLMDRLAVKVREINHAVVGGMES